MDRAKIDVSRYVQEMERALRSRQDPVRCEDAIAILRRWRFDEMLDDASRAKAEMLVREFDSTRWWQSTYDRRDRCVPTRGIPTRSNSRCG